MKITAVIFDLNGTIIEDEDEYGRAFGRVLKNLGVDSSSEYPHTLGIGVKANWPILIKKYNIKTDKTVEVLTKETQDAYLDELSEVRVRPGFQKFAEGLKESGIKIALATSNTWEIANVILEKIDVDGLFDAITTSEEVIYNKPDPDLFLLSADKLGVERADCLVIEDAPSGVLAAHRAGMKVIAIATNQNSAARLEEADLVVEGFGEITPKVIDQL